VTREIVKRHFYREFYQQTYASYSHEQQSRFLKDLQAYVTDTFGKDSDLTKSARYFELVILYN
jgi:hypothetical protein